MENFVEEKLTEWMLDALKETFATNCVDDKCSFDLLTTEAIKEMVPQVGLRLKFLAKFNEYKAEENNSVELDQTLTVELDQSFNADDSASVSSNVSLDSNAEDSPQPPLKKSKGHYNLRDVIMETHRGPQIVVALDNGSLHIRERRELTRILVSHLMEVHGDRPSTLEKVAMAKALIHEFPSQKDSEGEGFEAWFARGRGQHSATGYLEERLRNVRKRSEKTAKQLKKTSASGITSRTLPVTEITDGRAEEMKSWLKFNSAPQQQVEQFMAATVHHRTRWIRSSPAITLQQINEEYPRLLDRPGMIEQDFRGLFEEVCDKFLCKWETTYNKILSYAEKQSNTWKDYLGIQIPEDEIQKSLVAAQVLPCILPSGQIKNKHGKTVRASTTEALSSFVDVEPVGTNIPNFLERTRSEGKKKQPFVLILGTRILPSQVFLIIEGIAIEHKSLINALDACFKSFYIFDLEYPKQCHSTWEFVQKFYYGLEDGKGKTVTSPAVRSFRTFLSNC